MALVCETDRLRLDHFTEDDSAFVLELLNQPSFIRHISDKGVRNVEQARAYLVNGPMASYARYGFGLSRVTLKRSGAVAGMCGLIRRDGMQEVEIGYAFLPAFWSKGYAREAVAGVLRTAVTQHALQRVVAVVNPNNPESIRLLENLGFNFDGMVVLPGETTAIHKFSKDLSPCLRLSAEHIEPYRALMLQAYDLHPEAFTSSAAERAALPMQWWLARLDGGVAPQEVGFGAFHQGQLAGVAGLSFETRERVRHKATLFGMYVPEPFRQLGLGRLLVQACLDHARTRGGVRQVMLTVTQGNASAERLYAGCGFQVFGIEPDAVALGTSFVAKVHMWRRLDAVQAQADV
jgi:RimJ/RimL family protein N-acetyltransferase